MARHIINTKIHTPLKFRPLITVPPHPYPTRPRLSLYLWYTVLRPLGHWVWHRQMVNHHDVLIGLIHGGRRLCTRTNGRTAVWNGSSGRLDLRPLEKLGYGDKKCVFSKRQYIDIIP